MKTATDPRHKKREARVTALFSYSFRPLPDKSITDIVEKLPELDTAITAAAPEWPLSKINKIDLAILRVAVYELTFDKDVPEKVVIDEAVEIAKKYGAENSGSFVNGVLGTIVKEGKKTHAN